MSRNQIRLEFESKTTFAGGQSFGAVGPYERLLGMVHFAIDPNEKDLPFVCDIEYAPRNADGLVEFKAVIDIVKPVDMSKGNGKLLFDFSNRGGRGAFTRLNDGGGDLFKRVYAGNGFLNRQGYTVVTAGWQGDLVYNGSNVVAFLPEARRNGQPLRGKVRQEFISDKKGVLSMPVSGAANIQCYPVLDRATATLTMREKEADPRVAVPASDWELAKAKEKDGKVELTPSNADLYVKGGFKTGWIYELIYDTEGSRVMGLGFLGLRDLVSFLRHGSKDSAGAANPLAGAIDKVYGYGASLAGRVVREFVYEGWNRDAEGRRVFDAVQTHTGIGRLYFNMRFAQIGRYPRQHEEHSYPSERYPFNFAPVPDPFTGKVDSRAQASRHRPADRPLSYLERILGTPRLDDPHRSARRQRRRDSRQRAHVHARGIAARGDRRRQSEMGRSVAAEQFFTATVSARLLYAHGPLGEPRRAAAAEPRAATLRGTVGVARGSAQEISQNPRRQSARDAQPVAVVELRPRLRRARHHDYFPARGGAGKRVSDPSAAGGRRRQRLGRRALPGHAGADRDLYRLGAAQSRFRRRRADDDQRLLKAFVRTKAEREKIGDPRLSIEERYPSHQAYVEIVKRAVDELVKEGFLLPEDGEDYVEAAKRKNPLDPAVTIEPLVTAGRED